MYIPINDTNLISLNQNFNIILDASNASLNMGNTQITNPKIVFYYFNSSNVTVIINPNSLNVTFVV
jgi:hypothetical protein